MAPSTRSIEEFEAEGFTHIACLRRRMSLGLCPTVELLRCAVLRVRAVWYHPQKSHRATGTFHFTDSFPPKHCLFSSEREIEMRLSLIAALFIAVMTLPAEAARPVKGAVQGTATAAKSVAKGAGQAGVGIVRGTRTAVRGTASGFRCLVTLGHR